MQVVYARCCGLDVHHTTVVACVLLTEPTGRVQREVRTFGTMTADLLALNDWLNALGVEQVALESTGVYWRPVFNLLEADHELILVNAQHLKAVPGRKTDVKDSEWLADLLRHGLVKPSFIPPQPVRELRELTRYRKTLIQARAQEVNRLHKVLEGANLKLGAVATEVLGTSGRDMLAAILAGEADPAVLAELARGRLRAKLAQLRQALEGRVTAQHRLLIRHMLTSIDFLEQQLAELTTEIEAQLAPFAEAVVLLETIPGTARGCCDRHHRRDRCRHDALPLGQTLGILGGPVPRQQAEWRQTFARQDHHGQCLATRGAGRSGLVDYPHLRQLLGGALPPPGATAR
jgi:transposase